ncbi:MAG: antitoxin [Burkholderiales bacterium]
MKLAEKPTKTKVFRAGNSQAVRIPKAFELPEGDVLIEPRDGGLFISTLRGRWDLFAREPGVDLPFTASELRHQGSERDIDLKTLGGPSPRPTSRRAKKDIRSK